MARRSTTQAAPGTITSDQMNGFGLIDSCSSRLGDRAVSLKGASTTTAIAAARCRSAPAAPTIADLSLAGGQPPPSGGPIRSSTHPGDTSTSNSGCSISIASAAGWSIPTSRRAIAARGGERSRTFTCHRAVRPGPVHRRIPAGDEVLHSLGTDAEVEQPRPACRAARSAMSRASCAPSRCRCARTSSLPPSDPREMPGAPA